jgi:hypothetical protein
MMQTEIKLISNDIITNFFRKSGFTVSSCTSIDLEFGDEILWDQVIKKFSLEYQSFYDYVQSDNSLVYVGKLFDQEILDLVVGKIETDENEDANKDSDQETFIPSSSQAFRYIRDLRKYFRSFDLPNESIFDSVSKIEHGICDLRFKEKNKH